jgi:hypothetical protein
MPPLGFEPKISAGKRPHTYALDRAASGTGLFFFLYRELKYSRPYKRGIRYEHEKSSSHYHSQILCEIFKTKRYAKKVFDVFLTVHHSINLF